MKKWFFLWLVTLLGSVGGAEYFKLKYVCFDIRLPDGYPVAFSRLALMGGTGADFSGEEFLIGDSVRAAAVMPGRGKVSAGIQVNQCYSLRLDGERLEKCPFAGSLDARIEPGKKPIFACELCREP